MAGNVLFVEVKVEKDGEKEEQGDRGYGDISETRTGSALFMSKKTGCHKIKNVSSGPEIATCPATD